MMTEKAWNVLKWTGIGVVLIAICAIPYLTGRTEPMTRERLAAAQRLWRQADISNYDLDFDLTGDQTGRYHVEVRGGDVTSITWNGRPTDSHAASYYTVDGIFRTMEEDLDLVEDPTNQAFPPGSQVWLRMSSQPKLGYPIRYVRQVKLPAQRSASGVETSSGARGIEIHVTRLTPR